MEPNLEDVLNDKQLYSDFHEHLKLKFNEEKLECWVKMTTYDKAVDEKDYNLCEDILDALWTQHLSKNAPRPIYFDCIDIDKIQKSKTTKSHIPLFKMERQEIEFDLKNTFTKFAEEKQTQLI